MSGTTTARTGAVGRPGSAPTAHRRTAVLLGGFVGATLLAVGGLGAGALPAGDRVEALASVGFSLCVVGLALLSGAWVLARRLSTRAMLAACGLWSLPLLLGPPLASRDLYAYVGQGALVAGGLDPYEVGPAALPGPLSEGVDDVWIGTPAPYGPVWLALSGLVVRLTGQHLLPALLLTRLLAVAGVALAAWALVRLAHAHDVPAARALWLGVANPLVLLHFIAGGHNDALMVGLLLAGLAVVVSGSGPRLTALAVGAGLVTLAALIKVPAVVGLAFLPLLAAGGWGAPQRAALMRAALITAVSAAVTAVAATAVTGLGWGWVGALDAGRARLSLFSPLTGLGLALPGGDTTLDVVLGIGLIVTALLCLAMLLLAPRLGAVRALGLGLLGTSVLLPVVQPWYVLWGVLLLAAVASPRTAWALGAASLVLCVLIAPSGRNVIRPPLYGAPTLLAAAVAIWVARAGRNGLPDGEEEGQFTHVRPGQGTLVRPGQPRSRQPTEPR